jgi:phosphonate transport system permease protein
VVLGLGAAVVWSATSLDISAGALHRMPSEVARILVSFFPIDLAYARDEAIRAIVESIQIAWIGTLIGAVGSLPLGLFGARNLFPRSALLLKPVLAWVRTFPEILLAIYLLPIVGLGPFAGALAIGLHSIGTLGKLTADVVESMDLAPTEAVETSGGGHLTVLRFAVMPQVLPEIVALWLFRFEINVRASAVLGVIGAGGIGGLLLNTLRYREFSQAGAIVIVTVCVVLAIDAVSARLRARLVANA